MAKQSSKLSFHGVRKIAVMNRLLVEVSCVSGSPIPRLLAWIVQNCPFRRTSHLSRLLLMEELSKQNRLKISRRWGQAHTPRLEDARSCSVPAWSPPRIRVGALWRPRETQLVVQRISRRRLVLHRTFNLFCDVSAAYRAKCSSHFGVIGIIFVPDARLAPP
jgi:hypothetical protein